MVARKESKAAIFAAVDSYVQANYKHTANLDDVDESHEHRQRPDFTALILSGARRARRPSPSVQLGRGLLHLLDEVVAKPDPTFAEQLLQLIKQKGRKATDIYIKAGITRQHFSKIKNHPGYQPTKETALAFAIALHLSLSETNRLIGRAGFTLSHSSKRDLIVEFFIKHQYYDVDLINENLYLHGYAPLTNRRTSKA